MTIPIDETSVYYLNSQDLATASNECDDKCKGLSVHGPFKSSCCKSFSVNAISGDESKVQDRCCGDKECHDCLAELMNIINKRRFIGMNRCFSYMDQVINDIGFNVSSGYMLYCNGKISLVPREWIPGRFVPTTKGILGWYGLTAHAVMEVNFKCSGKTAYFDIGSDTHLGHLGGSDHFFFPGDQMIDAKTHEPVTCTTRPYTHGSEMNGLE